MKCIRVGLYRSAVYSEGLFVLFIYPLLACVFRVIDQSMAYFSPGSNMVVL